MKKLKCLECRRNLTDIEFEEQQITDDWFVVSAHYKCKCGHEHNIVYDKNTKYNLNNDNIEDYQQYKKWKAVSQRKPKLIKIESQSNDIF